MPDREKENLKKLLYNKKFIFDCDLEDPFVAMYFNDFTRLLEEERKKWIEKAYGWLNEVVEDEQSKYVWYDYEEGFCGITEELVKDFKKAMEE